MAYAYDCFKKYERKEFLTKIELEYANDHICLNLNNPSIRYKYFYNMYSCITKSFIVCNWKEKNGHDIISKFGKRSATTSWSIFSKMKNVNIARVRAFIIKFN